MRSDTIYPGQNHIAMLFGGLLQCFCSEQLVKKNTVETRNCISEYRDLSMRVISKSFVWNINPFNSRRSIPVILCCERYNNCT